MNYFRTLLVSLAWLSFATGTYAQDKPNVFLIMMDNLGWGEISVCDGGILRGAETPRLDAPAAEGLQLLSFNVEIQCTSSRSVLMTGRHPVRSGTTKLVWGQLYSRTQSEVAITELIPDQGYATGMFGEWQLGDVKGQLLADQGFDQWDCIANTTGESLYTEACQFGPKSMEAPHMVEAVKGHDPTEVKDNYLAVRRRIDDEIAERTMGFMNGSVDAGKPLFAYIPFDYVHIRAIPHPDFEGKTCHGDCADVLAEVDHRAGELLDAIGDLKTRENTVVIWISENGPEENFPKSLIDLGQGTIRWA